MTPILIRALVSKTKSIHADFQSLISGKWYPRLRLLITRHIKTMESQVREEDILLCANRSISKWENVWKLWRCSFVVASGATIRYFENLPGSLAPTVWIRTRFQLSRCQTLVGDDVWCMHYSEDATKQACFEKSWCMCHHFSLVNNKSRD